MINLMRVEWLKITRMGTSRILALVLVGMAFMISLVSTLNVNGSGNNNLQFRQDSFDRLKFPNSLVAGVNSLQNIGVIVMATLVAAVIGGEYGQDTWKNLLIRQPGRYRFILAKLLVVGGVFISAAVITILLNQLFSLAGYFLVQNNATASGLSSGAMGADQFYHDFYASAVPAVLYLLAVGSLSAVFTVATRTTVGGVMITIVWYIGENFSLRFLPDYFANFTLLKNINSLDAHLAGNPAVDIPLWQNLLITGCYIIVPVIVALVLFDKRDLAS